VAIYVTGISTPELHLESPPLLVTLTWIAPRMQAYVWWNCVNAGFKGGYYNYLNKVWGYIHSGSTTYGSTRRSRRAPGMPPALFNASDTGLRQNEPACGSRTVDGL
jgi:hypothetical protein